jgi:hypothetical protein
VQTSKQGVRQTHIVEQMSALGQELPRATLRDMSADLPISDITLRCDNWRGAPGRDLSAAHVLSPLCDCPSWSYGLASDRTQAERFEDFVRVSVSGDSSTAARLLDVSPLLAKERAVRGATRQALKQYFFDRIQHYIYEGDTALHIAAAAYQFRIVEKLIAKGADVRARNRRGAEPLHYAVDGGPGVPAWKPSAQIKIIARLIRAGADPNALDKNGVGPFHRAVRNRSAAAVKALLEAGADPRAPNARGSTPILLATQNTGRGGSGSAECKAQQQEILRILRAHGAA